MEYMNELYTDNTTVSHFELCDQQIFGYNEIIENVEYQMSLNKAEAALLQNMFKALDILDSRPFNTRRIKK